jgi:hypothetical protein
MEISLKNNWDSLHASFELFTLLKYLVAFKDFIIPVIVFSSHSKID